MIYLIILFSSTIVCSSDADVVQEDNVKIGQAGEDVNLTCTFSKLLQTTNCAVAACGEILFGKGTKLNFRVPYPLYVAFQDAAVDRHITLQQSSTDTLHPGDSVSLQCSIFTESCAGEHSVYWFRQSLGESQGILYTKGERNGQCENSTESQTQSCVYNLFKSNISHSDAGIYYCAVAACGEILFGKGTELNFRESVDVNPTLLVLGVLNIIFLTLAVFLAIKLCQDPNK
ncbi:uncharacterized protein LOC107708034, partial [Sinocyclocheilus rhinocerous]|uniref:uncharacterized protein LOC107708034 n=1 Tax=Sinocyclocheilus rhinocerous TaxID=307959 RepID=UPI0007B79EB6